jgi:hypothetical protein
MASVPQNALLTTVKSWLFPTVLSILALMLYDDIKEIKTDVKQLLAQSAADHVEIMNLKEETNTLHNKVFALNTFSIINKTNDKEQPPYIPDTCVNTLITLVDNKKYFKKSNS